MRELFDADESASSSGSTLDYSFFANLAAREGASSDRSFPSTDLVVWERESFQLPAKGKSSKSRTLDTIVQTELSNRYECLEDIAKIDDDSRGESGRKSPLSGSGRNWLKGEKFYQTTRAPSSGSKSPDCSEMTQSEQDVSPCCSNGTDCLEIGRTHLSG